jgi:hypothetical protein
LAGLRELLLRLPASLYSTTLRPCAQGNKDTIF